jgi:hypothetical protein
MRDTRHILARLTVSAGAALSAAALVLAGALSAAALVLAGSLPAVARADGDPASDVLVTQPVFVPRDAATGAARLQSVATAAVRAGYPLRVALIGSAADLGSVTALWRRPVDYARFLAQELSLAAPGRVLVVMPNGFGVAPETGREAAALKSVPIARGARQLPAAAVAAVAKLAAADGHALAPAALSPASMARPSADPTDAVALIVFAGGCVLIAVSWGLSLRARPWHPRRPGAPA